MEEDKPGGERGHYLHPAAFGQPEERGVEWARHPEVMRRMQESRAKPAEAANQKAPSPDR